MEQNQTPTTQSQMYSQTQAMQSQGKALSKVNLNYDQYECLRPNAGYRFSRSDAYLDILHVIRFGITDRETFLSLDDGVVMTNFSLLGERWKWNRTTVKLFLHSLESTSLFSLLKIGKYIFISE